MCRRKLFVLCCALLALLAAASRSVAPTFAQTSAAQTSTAQSLTPAQLLAAAKSWGYQLQEPDPDEIAAVPYDMIVIDYSRNGGDALALTPGEVDTLRSKPDGGRRSVLAYLSIGEAETYRYYWKWYWGWFFGALAPGWRGPQDREWRGNYGVRYWMEDWQKIIFRGDNSYLDRIIRNGFDGVYLDKVDEYVDMAKSNRDARAEMITFVKALAAHARAIKPGFLVVPQNGDELLTDDGYRAAIDGVGKEDLLFGEAKDKRANDAQSIADNVALLHLLTRERKPVFAVEYLDAPEKIADARRRLLAYGFIPYFADRALDHMRIGDLPDPARMPGRK
jgi:cysteinyl-tRNA synthetase